MRWTKRYRDGLNPVAELDGAGSVVKRFVYGSRLNVPDYVVTAGGTYRVITDHLGSPRRVVNVANGSDVLLEATYDEFGNASGVGLGGATFGFAGGLFDADTGLVRFGARDYDAAAGRWTAKDPILWEGEQSNLHAYVDNDPVNLIDPLGTQCEDADQQGGQAEDPNDALDAQIEQWLFRNSEEAIDVSLTVSQVAFALSGVGGVLAAAGFRARVGWHTAHHFFPQFGRALPHLQLNWWRAGLRGSGQVRRWALPRALGPARNRSINLSR